MWHMTTYEKGSKFRKKSIQAAAWANPLPHTLQGVGKPKREYCLTKARQLAP